MKVPSPTNHPNAYATLGSGSVAAFFIYEAQDRFNLTFNPVEQGMIVAIVAALYLFIGGKGRDNAES